MDSVEIIFVILGSDCHAIGTRFFAICYKCCLSTGKVYLKVLLLLLCLITMIFFVLDDGTSRKPVTITGPVCICFQWLVILSQYLQGFAPYQCTRTICATFFLFFVEAFIFHLNHCFQAKMRRQLFIICSRAESFRCEKIMCNTSK